MDSLLPKDIKEVMTNVKQNILEDLWDKEPKQSSPNAEILKYKLIVEIL